MRSSNTNSTKLPRWSEIPPELLQLLLEKLPSYFVHTLRFKAVCPSWNHAAKSYVSGPSYTPLPQSPWLMLPAQRRKKRLPSDPDVEEEGCFFSLAEEKVYRIKRNVFRGLRDDFYWSQCVGSSHGWLAIWNPKAGEIFKEIIYLANPICGESRTLPPLHVPFISKVVLSCNPSRNHNFVVVVASHGGGVGRLAFYKHGGGNTAWTKLDFVREHKYCEIAFHNCHLFALCSDHSASHGGGVGRLAFYKHGGGNTAWTKLDFVREHKYCEIVFHNCHLFALCSDHSVHVWDFGETYNHPKKTMELQPLMAQMVYGDGDGIRHRLVESMGEILLVEHGPLLYPSWDEISVPFYVYKLNFDAKRWEKVDSLGDRAIFLVENLSAMSLSTHKLPELEENSIYFTAEVSDSVRDERSCDFFEFHLGVYNLETKVVKSLYKSGLPGNRNDNSEPVWIVPNPQ
ncbi:hypothetical protein C1H46_005193 [Malus baccata]|uniref:KIB1-4 beta-propeller domain-containing protein n=1 Tax=Malus baccata TaxID=106549 RepID=A0A540NE02_MALBA|nr:hypothetical protein C1H46_005193 [Malus baccata]